MPNENKLREALELLRKLDDEPLRIVEHPDVSEVAIYGKPHPVDGGNYAALYRGYNKEFARAIVACVNYVSALEANPPAAASPKEAAPVSANAQFHEACERIYQKYGSDLSAFFRDVQASLAQPKEAARAQPERRKE